MSDVVKREPVDEIVERINRMDINKIELRAENQKFFKTVQAYQKCYDELEGLYNKIDPTGKLAEYEMKINQKLIQQLSKTGEPVQNIEELYEVAEKMSPVFEDKIHGLLEQLGSSSSPEEVSIVRFKLPPGQSKLKGKERAYAKAQDDYNDRVPGPGLSYLNDIVRGSVLFDNAEQLFRFLELLRAVDESIVIVKSKNRFKTPTLSGYRDFNLQIQISHVDDAGKKWQHICELQLHIAAIKEADTRLNSHALYEFFRKFYAGATDGLEERMEDMREICKGGSLDKAFLTNVVESPLKVDDMKRLVILFAEYMNEYQLAIVIANAMKESLEPGEWYNSIGSLIHKQGELEKAMKLYKKALEIKVKEVGEKHTSVADSYNSMAIVLKEQGKLGNAIELYGKALEIYVEALGPEDTDVANCYNNMANVLKDQGQLEEATKLFQKALEIYVEALGPHHTIVARIYSNMALVLELQGQLEKAMELYQKALDIQVKAIGPHHTDVAGSYNNMAVILSGQGELKKAMELYEKELEIEVKAVGQDHIKVAGTYNNMANVLKNQGQLEEATKLYQKALGIKVKSLGEEHTSVAETYSNMASVLEEQGELEEAMKLYKKALEIFSEAYGPNHPHTELCYGWVANCYNKMASVLEEQGKLEEALVLYEKALEISVKSFGEDHTIVANSYYNMASVRKQKGKLEKALELCQKALQIYSEAYGPDHDETKDCHEQISDVKKRLE